MKHAQRTRVAPGIYQDACGYLAEVCVRRARRGRRFARDTAIPFMQSWQIQQRAELDDEQDATPPDEPKPERGTWDADVEVYLPKIKGRVGYKADRSHLKAWGACIGHLNRSRIRAPQLQRGIAAWLEGGLSPRTIRHRVRVVRELYKTLDGAHAKPPIKGLKLPTISAPNPTAVSIEMIHRVAASLKRGLLVTKGCGPKGTKVAVQCADPDKTHARFLVRATTGQRPTQIMRATPEDLDFERGYWYVRAAKGGTAIPLALSQEMVWAWQAFIKANAWGAFDTRSFSTTIRRHGWPEGIRPYTLRHTFAIDHLLNGTDLGDLQGLLGHRQIETTRRFYAPVLLARLRKAGENRTLKLVKE